MTKDVIYIDVEDDITAIIGKIKASREKIVALVPPKRVGVLQSAVNLRLLAKTAENGHKHLVLITNNQALMALSAAAKIPVAKNLQSKPEIAEIAALEIDEGEDVIDGSQLPVGELEKTSDIKPETDKNGVEEAIETIDITPMAASASKIQPKPIEKNKIKVPDFSNFRKFLFLGVFLGTLFIGFLVWAIWFAPAAKVIITARTSPAPVSVALKLGDATDVSKGTIQTISKQIKRDASVDFDATGKDTVGEEARGVITLSNADSSDPISVPAGSIFSSGDFEFATVTAAEVPGAGVVGGEIVAGTVDVNVAAVDVGSDYNLSSRAYDSGIAGVSAFGGDMSGGSSKEVQVVTAGDVQKASEKLVALDDEEIKQELIAQFANGEIAIDSSFTVKRDSAVSSPAVGKEATGGKAKLTSSTTYTITAIAKSEIQVYLKDVITKQITNANTQKIYDDGIESAVLTGYLKTDKNTTVNLGTVGTIGPNINQDTIKEQVKGKRFGDIQSLLGNIEGVNDVDVRFSYFWVTTVPDDLNKIEIEFKLENA